MPNLVIAKHILVILSFLIALRVITTNKHLPIDPCMLSHPRNDSLLQLFYAFLNFFFNWRDFLNKENKRNVFL